MRCVSFFYEGKPRQLEISNLAHALLRSAVARTGQPQQNILIEAFKKYGINNGAVMRYAREQCRETSQNN